MATLTMSPLEQVISLGQACLSHCPVVVLGSGASAPYGLPGMAQLATHLQKELDATDLTLTEQHETAKFKGLLASTDLESALQQVALSAMLISRVVRHTWELIEPADRKVLDELVTKRQYLPLTKLLTHSFQSTHTKVTIVTPNYDRLAEFACDAAGFHHDTGFTFGYLKTRQKAPVALFNRTRTAQARVVEIWKVHGSLDWFTTASNEIISLPWPLSDMSSLKPLIVTPGTSKYQEAWNEPFRSILNGSDKALANAEAYLCIGFGFNDIHLTPKLTNRCTTTKVPLVILSRTLSTSARNLLAGGCQNYLALEKTGTDTTAYFKEEPKGVVLPNVELWSLDKFLEAVL